MCDLYLLLYCTLPGKALHGRYLVHGKGEPSLQQLSLALHCIINIIYSKGSDAAFSGIGRRR